MLRRSCAHVFHSMENLGPLGAAYPLGVSAWGSAVALATAPKMWNPTTDVNLRHELIQNNLTCRRALKRVVSEPGGLQYPPPPPPPPPAFLTLDTSAGEFFSLLFVLFRGPLCFAGETCSLGFHFASGMCN